VPVEDLTGLPAAEQDARTRELAREETRRAFDLATGPVWRARLLRWSEQDHLLLLTIQHIAFDGWSEAVFCRELASYYRAFAADEPSPLPAPPLQYADFAWQQRQQSLDKQKAYWRQRLQGFERNSDVPDDRGQSAQPDEGEESLRTVLPQKLVQALQDLSRREEATFFMTLVAVWQLLLSRQIGQEDIVTGIPTSGRNHPELESLIGYFVNTLPLRTNLSGEPTFRQLLGRVKEDCLGALAHPDLSLAAIVHDSGLKRPSDGNPLFTSIFNFIDMPGAVPEIPGLRMEVVTLEDQVTDLALNLRISREQAEFHATLTFSRALFSRERMERFLEQYLYLLEQVAGAPGDSVRCFSLVTPSVCRILPDPSAPLEEPGQELVGSQFLDWARRTPGQVAVRQGSADWTYAELAERAERIAWHLVAQGARPGDVVAIAGTRSLGLIAAMMGVLQSGAVLMPIDPSLPDKFKQDMLALAECRSIVLVGDDLGQTLPWLDAQGIQSFVVDALAQPCSRDGGLEVRPAVLPKIGGDDPAYIFFTSGTMGVPKGILGCHKGLSHFLRWQREEFAVGPADRVAQMISLSFDPVLRDVFLPLSSGATLCLPDRERQTAEETLLWLRQMGITLLHAGPTLAQFWLDFGPPSCSLPALRVVFFAGEPLTDKLVADWRRRTDYRGEIVNLYGPTETTMVKCFQRIPVANLRAGVQPIGRPMPQTQALVMDEHLRLCGIGECGEIVIRTPFRTLGYLASVKKLAFVPNPHRTDPTDLLYRTGDLGRFGPNGELHILGRRDDQVKIRGVRVEASEVAVVLNRHPDVRACAVMPYKNQAGDMYLAAYVVARQPDEGLVRKLRFHVAQFLPAAMVPAAFLFLDELPMNTNGKVNRQALPQPDIEKQAVPVEWNQTDVDYPSQQCVHELFENQTERTPDAVALESADRKMTYRELNASANALAWHLKELGVGPETLVGLCIDRSVEMVVGILGILKAGAAYVPLDLNYPRQRLAFMLEDSQAGLVLTRQRLLHAMPDQKTKTLCLDAFAEAGDRDSANPPKVGTPDDLAYVMYTSGSTGKPKGVAIPHRGIIRLVCGTDYLQFDASQAFLQMSSISFDGSTLELWGALLHGGRCVLLPDQVPTLDRIGQIIREHGVTTMWMTAALFNAVIDEAPQILKSVRQIVAGGEALSVPRVCRALARLPETQLINGYGPTETTTFACCYRIPRDFSERSTSVPIGPPIANTTAYVLDANLQPAPVGVAGELHIGGPGLARGYWNRPELTAEKFIPNPFSADPQARLYKTGDLVRWLADGNLEFLGRIDNQVKIRGYRIELGEIEAVLAQAPFLRQAVVLAHGEPGDKRLTGYVVPAEPASRPSPDEMRTFLRDKLPGFMIPSSWVLLEKLPLTPNGKVDRQVLPLPRFVAAATKHEVTAPRTPTEATLAKIWSDVLHQDKIGVHDDFFELGGHSLLVMQVVGRIRQALRVDLRLKSVFEYPTIERLAEKIERDSASGQGNPMADIVPVARDRDLPLTSAQRGIWFIGQLEPSFGVYNIPFALEIAGPLSVLVLERCLVEIVRRHEALRTSFKIVDGRPVQLPAAPRRFQSRVIDLSPLDPERRAQEKRRLLQEAAELPFDMGHPAMFRLGLVRLEENQHVLFGAIHHIVADGWSIEIFFQELATLYRAFAVDEPSPLPELAFQFADFAVWQENRLNQKRRQELVDFWKQQLAGAPPALELPTDRPRVPRQTFRGGFCTHQLPPDMVAGLRELSGRHHATLFMAMMAGFQILLARLSRQNDIVVGVPVSGRPTQESERLIGLFENLVPLYTKIDDKLSFVDVLERVRENAVNAYSHHELPFEILVDSLRVPRHSSRNPLVQVVFDFLNYPKDAMEVPSGLTMQRLALAPRFAKFELTLFLEETKQGMLMTASFNADLFDEPRIAHLLQQYRQLLEIVLREPFEDLGTLGLILPAPGSAPRASENKPDRVAPGNPTQVMLAQIWEELLGTPSIGILDDFFEIGGHSLLVIRMLARIEQVFGQTLPLATVLAGPTLHHLARALQVPKLNIETPIVQIQPGDGKRPFFFLHGDYYGGGLYTRPLAKHCGQDQPFFVIQPHGLAGQEPPSTLLAMADDHLRLMRKVQPHGPYLLGGYCNGALEAFAMAQLLHSEGEKVDLLVLIDPPALDRLAVASVEEPAVDVPGEVDVKSEALFQQRKRYLKLCSQACAGYRIAPYSGPVVFLISSKWDTILRASTNEWGNLAKDNGWQLVPGDHGTMITKHAAEVGRRIRDSLKRGNDSAPQLRS